MVTFEHAIATYLFSVSEFCFVYLFCVGFPFFKGGVNVIDCNYFLFPFCN